MKITKNTVVQLTYELHEGNANGPVVERVEAEQPLTFIYGVGQMIPAFEQNLSELTPEDKFEFTIVSDEAYGAPDPERVTQLPKAIFEGYEDHLQEGAVLPMRNEQNGSTMPATVLEVNDDSVLMDFNHPMAGKDLHFIGQVMNTRMATTEELEHGHVHGPGGTEH